MRRICIISLLFVFNLTQLLAQETPIRVDTCQLVTPFDLVGKIVFCKDNAFKINDLANQSFELFTKEKVYSLQADSTYWFRFTLINYSATTEFKALLFTDKQSVTALFEPDERVLKGGEHTIYSESAILDDLDRLPISVLPSTEKTYYLRVKTLNKKLVSIPLQLQSEAYKLKQVEKWRFDNRGEIFFEGIFLFTLFIVVLFSLIQGRLVRDKTYFYYAFYLLPILLYYARNFERHLGYPILSLRYPITYDLLEVYLNCTSYLFYILFFRQFLDLPNKSPKIDRILRGMFWAIVGLLGINILIQIFGGIKASLWFFDRMRVVFFIFVIFYYYVLLIFRGDKWTLLLGLGVLAIVLPAAVSVWENVTGSVLTYSHWGMWRHYQLGNIHFGFYHIWIGILIEIACFSTALYYKTKAERQKNAEMRQHFTTLSNEHEALKQQQAQAEKVRLELAEKEVILQRQIALMKRQVVDNQENTSENDFILRGLKIIDDNLQNPDFSIEDFAKAMHLARGKFYADWKKATGQTPNESIQNARLSAIQRLLLTTDLTVAEIAHQTGFNEAAYLSRFFQQKMGQSPTDFRLKKG
jgi:AraC-like DNA-binding protein